MDTVCGYGSKISKAKRWQASRKLSAGLGKAGNLQSEGTAGLFRIVNSDRLQGFSTT